MQDILKTEYGPLVLAGQFPLGKIDFDLQPKQGPEIQELAPLKIPVLTASHSEAGQWIKPIAGQPLTFRTIGQQQDVILKPINQSWERFAVYWTVA